MHDYALVDMSCRVCHLLVKPRAMFQHMKSHYMTFTCAVCDKEFKDSDAMDRHLSPKGVCDPDAWPCTNCGEVFGTESSLLAHVEASHRSRNQSKGVNRRKKVHKCEICDKVLTTHESRRCHMRIHTGERPFACPWCPKTFRAKDYLRKHINTHTGDRPFQCAMCDKAFSSYSNRRRHMQEVNKYGGTTIRKDKRIRGKRIVKKKRFLCDTCGGVFESVAAGLHHQRIHSDKTYFECDICSKRFKFKEALKGHIERHSRRRPFKCALCPLAFNLKSNLQRHQLVHTKERPFSCAACGGRRAVHGAVGRHAAHAGGARGAQTAAAQAQQATLTNMRMLNIFMKIKTVMNKKVL